MELECNDMDVESNAGDMMDVEVQDGRANIPNIALSKDRDWMDIEYQEGHTSTLDMMDVEGMNGQTMMEVPDNYRGTHGTRYSDAMIKELDFLTQSIPKRAKRPSSSNVRAQDLKTRAPSIPEKARQSSSAAMMEELDFLTQSIPERANRPSSSNVRVNALKTRAPTIPEKARQTSSDAMMDELNLLTQSIPERANRPRSKRKR